MATTVDELEARWRALPAAAVGRGQVELIVLRTGNGAHETPAEATLSPSGGVHGDRWSQGAAPRAGCQVTLMNVEVARLIAGEEPLHLAGDNFLVDIDLAEEALPVGSRIRVGAALLEVSADPHTGCKKFATRFGAEALKWVNGKSRRARRLRGVNCQVLEAGSVELGGAVEVLVD